MRTLRYLPFVALAGVHGFALFLPYLMLIVAAAYVAERMRAQPQAPARPAPVPVGA
jgi:hypothetical protein